MQEDDEVVDALLEAFRVDAEGGLRPGVWENALDTAFTAEPSAELAGLVPVIDDEAVRSWPWGQATVAWTAWTGSRGVMAQARIPARPAMTAMSRASFNRLEWSAPEASGSGPAAPGCVEDTDTNAHRRRRG